MDCTTSGTKPGILAAVLSALVRSYVFDREIHSISRVLYDLVFLVFALLMTAASETHLAEAQRLTRLRSPISRFRSSFARVSSDVRSATLASSSSRVWAGRGKLTTEPEAGCGRSRAETLYISPKNGIAFMVSIRNSACRPGSNGCSAFIRRIALSGERQSIEQSGKNRITKWGSASFFRAGSSNTSTPSVIPF
jgi:hypothetical protein